MHPTKEFLHEDEVSNNSEKSFALPIISDSEDSEVTKYSYSTSDMHAYFLSYIIS